MDAMNPKEAEELRLKYLGLYRDYKALEDAVRGALTANYRTASTLRIAQRFIDDGLVHAVGEVVSPHETEQAEDSLDHLAATLSYRSDKP